MYKYLIKSIYPIIELAKIELLTMTCVVFWNFPALQIILYFSLTLMCIIYYTNFIVFANLFNNG